MSYFPLASRAVSSEVQIIVLKSIASMAEKHKSIFETYLKSFYVHSTDSSLVKCYKLEILTILANASNINTILREFQVGLQLEDMTMLFHSLVDLRAQSG